MGAFAEGLSNCCNYFLRLSGFPNLFGKVCFITFKCFLAFSFLNISQGQCKTNWFLCLVLLKYTEVITVKLYFFIKSHKSKKKKLTSFYLLSQLRNMVGQFKKSLVA